MLMKNFGHPVPKIHSPNATEISCDSSGVRHALAHSGRRAVASTMTLRRDAFPASPVNARLSQALQLRIASAMLSLSHRKQKRKILPILNSLWESYATLKEASALEAYHDACYGIAEIHSLFSHGIINLKQRAYAEKLYYVICCKVRSYLDPSLRAHREIFDELNDKLADKFLCNFSLFQSLPDAWAIDQIFPILPLTDLNKKPSRHGVLHDITCDSDGVIDTYVNNRGLETRLSLSPYDPECPYLIAIFLVGAYQEILGDLHNLFGDTDSVQVEHTSGGYKLINAKQGDSIKEILGYVDFDPNSLIESYQKQLKNSDLNSKEYKKYLAILLKSLHSHTYFKA